LSGRRGAGSQQARSLLEGCRGRPQRTRDAKDWAPAAENC
jgi:hypothetical protein